MRIALLLSITWVMSWDALVHRAGHPVSGRDLIFWWRLFLMGRSTLEFMAVSREKRTKPD